MIKQLHIFLTITYAVGPSPRYINMDDNFGGFVKETIDNLLEVKC